ncbi:MAG: SRPBCC family protein [Bacteroidota bacterium]
MRDTSYSIRSDIQLAETLPADFYQNEQAWKACQESIFTQTWQYLGDQQLLFNGPENAVPLWLHEKYLDEPLLLSQTEDGLRCMTNVCTHRGYLLVHHPAQVRKLICRYHGRKFDLAGKFESMPEFEAAKEFPRPCDHLHQLPLANWRQFLFTRLGGQADFASIHEQLERRLYFLPFEDFRFAPEYSKTYNVHAHWALYCDNYLEGFHIPFVHQGLRKILDYGSYSTECKDQMVLQIGYSDGKGFTFDLPEGHPDYGKHVTAYYYWLFPNFMLNVYPWGVQLNIVKPVSPAFTKVEFLYYLYDEEIFALMDGDQLAEKTEREDEFVVEAVQRGIRSRFYQSGRFSPKREKGVHHFHRLIAQALSTPTPDS